MGQEEQMGTRESGVVAIYARISKKDQKYPEKNQSVENQIRLAMDYIQADSGLRHMKIQVFRDEGYTGTNLNRPAVSKLLAGIYLGRIQALVVKDFSRLSRNHIQLSELREKVFLRYSLIFVSIGDQYDSRDQGSRELSAGLQSVFYEYYCRDVSRKVKQALAAKKQKGEYAAARAPYGYRRGVEGGLEIHPQEARVVREIFYQAEMGKNTARIAEWMNHWQEEISGEWQGEISGKWQGAAIWRILNNPVYMGIHVWHKTENQYRNGFYRENLDREQWIQEESVYPAIVSREQFEKISRLQRRTAGYGKKKGKRHIFHGITRCGYCGKALCRHRRERDLLVCKEKHGGKDISVQWEVLWKICKTAWGQQEGLPEQEWEITLLLRQSVQRITCGPGQQVRIDWKVRE